MDHLLDYGSISIVWRQPRTDTQDDWVTVTARCICGITLHGEGTSYVAAKEQLDQRLAEHATNAGSSQALPEV